MLIGLKRNNPGVAMAEEHAKPNPQESLVETSDGTGHLMEPECTISITESFSLFTLNEVVGSTSTKNSSGCASLLDPASSSSQYFSTRIQSIMESRSEFGSNLETEIEESKVHSSEVQARNGEQGCAEANFKVFRSLQQQFGGPEGFFRVWNDKVLALVEKIGEGAQSAIFEVRFLAPELASMNNMTILKVFKLEGWRLEGLQKQWPPSMLRNAYACKNHQYYMSDFCALIGSAMILKDGRFAFWMSRYWRDLRKVIDLRMLHNSNHAPPFSYHMALMIMWNIAIGMRGLHKDNIVHRDLKASNVLISPYSQGDFNSLIDIFTWMIANFECSVGVVGTRFWRALEILLGIKNRHIQSSLFTKKSNVYSYAMTCYEILTHKIPYKDVADNNYDAVLEGARPVLPSCIDPWIKLLIERCWHRDPWKRPSFEDIDAMFEFRIARGLSKLFITGPKLLLTKILRS